MDERATIAGLFRELTMSPAEHADREDKRLRRRQLMGCDTIADHRRAFEARRRACDAMDEAELER